MTEWVSQADAVKMLAELGDKISQQALSQYLAGHPEIAREDQGPGKGQLIDFAALARSRRTRNARGPAATPTASAPEPAAREEVNPLGDRKARADIDRAEADARRARVLADEAEGRVIDRATAGAAFMAAGIALTRVMEEKRRGLIEQLRAARDNREAELAMRQYERSVRTGFADQLERIAGEAEAEALRAA
jgi:hypothetical protein